jgi:hypothetical protein
MTKLPKTPKTSKSSKPKKRFRISKDTKHHLIQAILIFASVFMAFWLNEYRLKQIQKNETARALEAVVDEVESNLDILERWAPYHKSMLERLEDLFEKDSVRHLAHFNPAILSDNYIGFMREILTRHAWDFIHAQNIQFDLETRLDIIMVYEQQKFVDKSLDRLIEMNYQRQTFDPEKMVENYQLLHSMLGDLWGQEVAMIENYRYRLDRIKKQGKVKGIWKFLVYPFPTMASIARCASLSEKPDTKASRKVIKWFIEWKY